MSALSDTGKPTIIKMKTNNDILKEFEKKFIDKCVTPQGGKEIWNFITQTVIPSVEKEMIKNMEHYIDEASNAGYEAGQEGR